LDRRDIAVRLGVSPGTVDAYRAHLTMGTYGSAADNVLPTDASAPVHALAANPGPDLEIVDAFDAIISLERDLQAALRRNIDQLETGLTIIDGGKERTVPSGRIDITARDASGATVVVELKAQDADRDAVAQLLGYMGDMIADGETVRGILIAPGFSQRAISAARAVCGLQLIRYGVKFSFHSINDTAFPRQRASAQDVVQSTSA
jgi:hypothetical protein